MYNTCLAPTPTITSFGAYVELLSRCSLSIIACFKTGRPPAGVYFVKPFSIESIAASKMLRGVLKSGSPAPKPITSIPSAFSAFALAVIAKVVDGVNVFTRSANTFFTSHHSPQLL